MAADRSRLAAALAYEDDRKRRLAESIPTLTGPTTAPRRSVRTDLENLSAGLGQGITTQLEGIKGLITDPVGTAKGAYEGVKAAVRDPAIIADALRYTAQKATSGPLGAGEVIGEMVGPTRGAGGVGKRDIFIGKSAKTWNEKQADRALAMEAVDVDPETIWQETGTFRGPDGQLRQEIPDEMAFKPKFGLEGGESLAYDVNEAVFHPAMRKAYPNIMEETLTTVRYKPDAPEAGYYSPRLPAEGGYVGRDPEIMVSGKNRDEMKSVMAHELQHAVQQKEGFSRGGNPDQFPVMSKDVRESTIDWVRNKIANVAAKKYKDAEFVFSGMERGKPETFADPEINALMKKLKSLEISADPREQYKRLAGEAEARATQARRGMTMEQRRATFPYKSYDIPLDELILSKK